MNKFIQLHKGLFKFILSEIKTKRTLQERIPIIKNLVISYFKFWGQELKGIKAYLFDKEYKESLKKFKRQENLKKEFQRALQLLKYLDKKMIKMGLNRTTRRQHWRDFFKSETIRTETFNELAEEIKK